MAMPDIVIIGAGPAGIRAAETLVEQGLPITLIDEGERGGGQIYRRQPAGFRRSYAALYGSEAGKAKALHDTFDRLKARIDYRPYTLAWNIADKVLHTVSGAVARAVRFDAAIFATGATDRLIPVDGWTTPGVYSLGAAQIALKAQACAIGDTVVFMGTGPLLYLVACQYVKAGARVAAVLDTSPLSARRQALPRFLTSRPGLALRGLGLMLQLRSAGVPVETGITPLAITNDGATVTGLRYRRSDGEIVEMDCDAVGLGYHLRPETQLADLAGCAMSFDEASRLWLPKTDTDGRASVAGLYLAGDGARIAGADAAEISGRLAAFALLADLGFRVPETECRALRRAAQRLERFRLALAMAFPWPHWLGKEIADQVLVCRCEKVSAGELRHAATTLGAAELNRAKAFSRVGMGRCQGRYCGTIAAEIVASASGQPVDSIGRLRGQAPVKPLPLDTTAEEAA
jgi:NADPH-dependent 2,4-dienoyl-CoA reductase/sulfur reductase-like enzyme